MPGETGEEKFLSRHVGVSQLEIDKECNPPNELTKLRKNYQNHGLQGSDFDETLYSDRFDHEESEFPHPTPGKRIYPLHRNPNLGPLTVLRKTAFPDLLDFLFILKALPGTALCADAGNAVYGKVVDVLLLKCKDLIKFAPISMQWRIQNLEAMNPETRGDAIEAALAAAMYAKAYQSGRKLIYGELEGGSCADGDLPT